MKRSNKILISTIAVIGIGVASISMVTAHGGFNRHGGCSGGFGDAQPWQQSQGYMMQHRGFNRGFGPGMEQYMQQRLDQVKYKLRITEEQEPAWQEFTQVIDNKVASMRDRMQQRGIQKTVTQRIQHLRDGADHMSQVAGAIERLYKTLTPEQQKVADQITPMRMRGF